MFIYVQEGVADIARATVYSIASDSDRSRSLLSRSALGPAKGDLFLEILSVDLLHWNVQETTVSREAYMIYTCKKTPRGTEQEQSIRETMYQGLYLTLALNRGPYNQKTHGIGIIARLMKPNRLVAQPIPRPSYI